MGIEHSDVAYTDETLLLYPRGFVYKIGDADSVLYLGCYNSDIENVLLYFKGKSNLSKFKIHTQLNRDFLELTDTIRIEPLELKLKHFKTVNGNDYLINPNVGFVIIYYWCNEMLDKHFIKNFRYFKKYALDHPELNIQVIAVSTDKL